MAVKFIFNCKVFLQCRPGKKWNDTGNAHTGWIYQDSAFKVRLNSHVPAYRASDC